MNRRNKIRVLKELRNISALARTSGKCVSYKKKYESDNNTLKLRK